MREEDDGVSPPLYHSNARKRALLMSALCLVLLAGQTSGLILLMRYTLNHRRQQPNSQGYSAASVVVSVEVVKLVFSLIMELTMGAGARTPARVLHTLLQDIRHHLGLTLRLAIPAALYALQNNLSYYALARITAVSFQVIQQLKILTTAFFAVLLLSKRLSWRHWIALGLLTMGVIFVQLSNVIHREGGSGESGADNTTSTAVMDAWLGFLVMVVNSLSSGFAGVYFEKLVKGGASAHPPRPEPPIRPILEVMHATDGEDADSNAGGQDSSEEGPHHPSPSPRRSLWIQSLELGIFGLAFSLLILAIEWGNVQRVGGFWAGYDGLTYAVILMQALGGLLVALVVRYADSILKAFATSVSIAFSAILSHLLRLEQSSSNPLGEHSNWTLSWSLLAGSALVGIALYLYAVADNLQAQMTARLTAVSVATDKTHKL